MDGLGVAASIIAVVELSAKVASLCIQYSLAVKRAKADIERLEGEINRLTDLLQEVERLLKRPDNTQLSNSEKLCDALKDCFSQLTKLITKLDLGKGRKTMSRLGIRALKWPFESKEVDKAIKDLERCKQTITLALQVDQTAILLDINQKIDLAKLPFVKGAAFDSHLNEHDPRCLPNTRIDLQREIAEWAEDAEGKCIFWLNGMAGTGKSTISRTVAQTFADKGQLGGSFFFKRGEGDRGSATKFFTTIAGQLANKVNSVSADIRTAIDNDPAISEKPLKKQFEKLILGPLSRIQNISPLNLRLILVVDALDECEREDDVRTILHLLSQVRDTTSVCVRVFITSRPELPIRSSFKKMEGGTYQHMVLHEISDVTIEHDISVLFQHELTKIRIDHSLPMYWPGQKNIQTLIKMAVPLFIFAATVCRFIGDPRWDPKKRLATILKYQTASQASKLDKTYLPILDQLLDEQDEVEKKKLAEDFQDIIGTIVVLANPLPTISLASLIGISEDDVSLRIDSLQSVLSIPTNEAQPVRLLHLSFRDFLLDPQKRGKSLFWVDERKTHERIARKCLKLMSTPNCLKQDICNLQKPGTLRSEIDSHIINDYLPAEVKYACRYWMYHLEQSKSSIYDNDQVHCFLQEHLLHWLEVMCLLGNIAESIIMIITLHSILNADKSPHLYAFIHDAKRFALYSRTIIEQAPLQIYCSALLFAPENSLVRKQFERCIPLWIQRKPKMEVNWNALLQTLEGHSDEINAVTFSPDGTQLASASRDNTVRLWDAATGTTLQTLEGPHAGIVNAVAFSPDGTQLAFGGSEDGSVRLCDVATGTALKTFEGRCDDGLFTVTFSPDGKKLASGSTQGSIQMWDNATGITLQAFGGPSSGSSVNTIAFSPDGMQLASGSEDGTTRLWDTATGTILHSFKGSSSEVSTVAFSPDGKKLASVSKNGNVQLWDPTTGFNLQAFWSYTGTVNSCKFSPDGTQLLVSGYDVETVLLWNSATETVLETLKGHTDIVADMAFSPDGTQLASASWDNTVRLWDAVTDPTLQRLKGHKFEGHTDRVFTVIFSPDGTQLASGSSDSTMWLWDTATGIALQIFEGHTDIVSAIAFAPNSRRLASGSLDSTVRLWDADTGTTFLTLEGHTDTVSAVAFSPNSRRVASGSWDDTVRLWDAATGTPFRKLEGHTSLVSAVAFSPDSKQLVSVSFDMTVRLWDTGTGSALKTLESLINRVGTVSFSPDGMQIMSTCLHGGTVQLWDAVKGTALQTHKCNADVQNFNSSEYGFWAIRIQPSIHADTCIESTSTTAMYVSDQWIYQGGNNILWLPTEYRSNAIAVYESTVAIGCSSGRVLVFEFDFNKLPVT